MHKELYDGRSASPAYRRFVLAMLFVVFALNFLDRQIISILAVPIKNELHLSDSQLGAMGGLAFAILYTFAGLPVALLADRTRRIWVISGAVALWSLFTSLCGLSANFLQLFLCRVGVGIGEAGGTGPCYALIADYFPSRQRARAMGMFALGIPLGTATGLLIGGYVATWFGWRGAFIAVGLIGLIFAPLLFLTVREPARGAFDPVAKDAAAKASFKTAFAFLRHKPAFWTLSSGAAMISMTSYGLAFWLPIYFQRGPALTITQTAEVMAIITVVGGLIGMPLGGYLADRLGRERRGNYAFIPLASFFLAWPALIAGVSTTNLSLSIAFLIIPNAVGCFWVPPTLTAVQHLSPPHMRVTCTSIYAFIVTFVGLGIGTLFLGGLSDMFAGKYGISALRHSVIFGMSCMYPVAMLLYFLTGRRLANDWIG